MRLGDTPLQTNIESNQLVIRIGIDTLAFAGDADNNGPLGEGWTVTNPRVFAQDVIRELDREDEIGSTILNRALDQAIKEAADQGSTAVAKVKVTK